MFNMIQAYKLPVAYITNGQNVPDDITKIDTQETAKKLLGGND